MIEYDNLLKRFEPFSSMSESLLNDVSGMTEKITVERKRILRPENGRIYLVLTGKISEYKYDDKMNKFYIDHHTLGQLIGMFHSENEFQAREKTDLLKINYPSLKRVISDYRLQALEGKLYKLQKKCFDLVFLGVEERIIKGMERQDFEGMSKQQVAYHVGASREMVSRVCSKHGYLPGRAPNED